MRKPVPEHILNASRVTNPSINLLREPRTFLVRKPGKLEINGRVILVSEWGIYQNFVVETPAMGIKIGNTMIEKSSFEMAGVCDNVYRERIRLKTASDIGSYSHKS